MKIAFDLDGVIFQFDAAVFELINQLNLREQFPDLPRHEGEITEWNWGVDDSFWRIIWTRISNNPDFWIGLRPYLDALRLRDRIKPYAYITARPVPSAVTYESLIRNGFPTNALIETVDPHNTNKVDFIREHGINFYVEDKLETFLAVNAETDCICFLIDRPYNQFESEEDQPFADLRVKNLEEFLDRVDEIVAYRAATTPETPAEDEIVENPVAETGEGESSDLSLSEAFIGRMKEIAEEGINTTVAEVIDEEILRLDSESSIPEDAGDPAGFTEGIEIVVIEEGEVMPDEDFERLKGSVEEMVDDINAETEDNG